MAASQDEVFVAFAKVVESHPDGLEAGPKVLLEKLKAEDSKHADVNIMKAKKMLQKIRQEKADGVIEPTNYKKQIAAECKRHSTCPGKHGLTRYIAKHEGFCCNICHRTQSRNKCVPIGSVMWGCRVCDWDICEEKCFDATPQEGPVSKKQQLEDVIKGLQAKLDRSVAVAPDQEKLEKILKLITQEIHTHEEKISQCPIEEWVKSSDDDVDDEETAKEQKAWFLDRLAEMQLKVQKAVDNGPVQAPPDAAIGA